MPSRPMNLNRSARLERIREKIADLQRIEVEEAKAAKRCEALLDHIRKGGFTRSDIMWCYHSLPLMSEQDDAARSKQLGVPKPQRKKLQRPAKHAKDELIPRGLHLRKLIEAKGLTLKQVSKPLGVSDALISIYCRGIHPIREELAEKLSKLLGEKV